MVPSGPGAEVMAMSSIAFWSFISLSVIVISKRLFPFIGGFVDTSGMSWCGEDWFVLLS